MSVIIFYKTLALYRNSDVYLYGTIRNKMKTIKENLSENRNIVISTLLSKFYYYIVDTKILMTDFLNYCVSEEWDFNSDETEVTKRRILRAIDLFYAANVNSYLTDHSKLSDANYNTRRNAFNTHC